MEKKKKQTEPEACKVAKKCGGCQYLDDAVRALHTAYGLDADQVEAVVYGGTGR